MYYSQFNGLNNETIKAPLLVTGPSKFKIIALNPTRDEISKLYGREQEKEPTYILENERGKTYIKTFYVKDITNDKLGKITFLIGDSVKYAGTDKDKVKVMNQYGLVNNLWVNKAGFELLKKDERTSYFKDIAETSFEKQYHLHYGEENLIKFIQVFLDYNPRNEKGRKVFNMDQLVGDWKSFCEGDHSTIQGLIDFDGEATLIWGIDRKDGVDRQTILNGSDYMFYKWQTDISRAKSQFDRDSLNPNYAPNFTFSMTFMEYDPKRCVDYKQSEWEV